MIPPFRDLRLRSKLILIIVAVSSLSVLTASILFIVNDAYNFRRSVQNDLQTLATMLGNNSRGALTFRDQRAAQETISAVETNPRILAAYLLTKENTLFANYVSKHADTAQLKLTPLTGSGEAPVGEQAMARLVEQADSFWNWDYVVSPVLVDNEVIGSVVIQSDPRELTARIRWFVSIVLIVMLCVFILFYLLSSFVQGIISDPIVGLSNTMKQVTENKDYTIRARKTGNDEVGVLIDGFNDMLAQIQQHGEAVETYRKFLEAEVAKSTTASNEWRMTFDSTKDAIIMLDAEDIVVRANRASVAFLHRPITETKGVSVHKLFAETGLSPLLVPLTRSTETKKHEEEEVHIAEKHLWMIASADPILAAEDQARGTVLVLRDISDRRKAEDAQKVLHAQLIQVQKMDSIGRLAGGIAHDFNNILSSIIGYSELALMKLPQDHPVAQDLQIICDSGDRAAALTRQLLAFSRKQVLEMKVVDLNAVIGNTVKLFSRLLGEHIILDQELHQPLPNIVADVGQLEQVLMNLMVNARDAMPAGGRLTIATRNSGPQVTLTVTDTGTGISPEVQQHMFEPFFTTKERGKGTGLGLATVYGIIEQHSGTITVESELGRGTTFSIQIPATDRAVDRAEDRKTAVMKRGTETILVVDDESSIRSLIGNILRPLGYRILEASQGQDALKISREYAGSIDLLLSDIVMPGMNGPALAKRIAYERPGIKVIFISGYIDEAIADEDLADPRLIVIQKPLTSQILTSRVREVLDRKQEEPVPPTGQPDLRAVRILYADDDESVRQLVTALLAPAQCSLTLCENGHRAVEQFKAGPFDLVVLDMQMPVMDGAESVRAMRMWEAEHGMNPTPIIALTGTAIATGESLPQDSGFTAHMVKPVNRGLLLDMLSRYAPQHKPAQGGQDAQNYDGATTVTIDKALQGLVPEYLKKRREDVRSLNAALLTGDFEAVRIVGHTMKGSGGGYGFDAISEIGSVLEAAAKRSSSGDIRRGVADLQHYLDSVTVRYS